MDVSKVKELFTDKLAVLFHNKKGGVFLCIGIAGMALILLSSFLPAKGKEPSAAGTDEISASQYTAEMEQRLEKIIGSIDGVGRCEVMVTVENDVEYVYAIEESQSVAENNSYEGDEVKKQNQQQNSAQKYIIVDAGGGKKEALLKTRKPPAIQGVVVVCEGAGNKVVQQRITEAAATALGVSYNKVCVTKIKK